jgi:DNA-cytosine methyltransferase
MNVLSLFDGLSCGNIALEKAGIKVDNYYASEIDQYAIKIANKNYPSIIQLGDVTKFDETKLPKIDLLIGGSPCQGFSFGGKQLNFDDPRSKLFFVYAYMLKQLKPKYFLLENVRMAKQSQDVISEYLGVEPIEINSSLVSAQNRKRLYWTNIPNVTQPEDKGILLKDVLLDDAEEPMLLNIYGGFKEKKPRVHTDKSVTIRAASGGGAIPSVKLKQHIDNESATKKGKAYALTASYSKAVAWNSIQKKQRTMIPITLSNETGSNIYNGAKYRKLHPVECERLQTIPDGYTSGVSNSQRYKMLGNSWTADVICHIFKGIKENG